MEHRVNRNNTPRLQQSHVRFYCQ